MSKGPAMKKETITITNKGDGYITASDSYGTTGWAKTNNPRRLDTEIQSASHALGRLKAIRRHLNWQKKCAETDLARATGLTARRNAVIREIGWNHPYAAARPETRKAVDLILEARGQA